MADHIEWIDITTNGINTNTGVYGSNNNFVVNISNLSLDGTYGLVVYKLIYQNSNLTPDVVYPIVLCGEIKPIRVNNTFSSIIYYGRFRADSSDLIYDDATNNTSMSALLVNNIINQLSFSIVRSDNGQLFPINPLSVLRILVGIKKITI